MALVLAPTRELAVQIFESAKPFVKKVNIDMSVIYGGAPGWPQKEELNRGVDLLIATPGRLLEFIEKKNIYLKRVFYLVLDEADRMLDMGFMPQVKEICTSIKTSRQTLLWSATWPKDVEALSKEVCNANPARLTIGSENLTVNQDIGQNVEVIDDFKKKDRIIELLREMTKNNKDKILIFCKTKKGCDRLTKSLEYEQYKAVALHGDKAQNVKKKLKILKINLIFRLGIILFLSSERVEKTFLLPLTWLLEV
jgi:ATP-dependent RNA helicase DDX5/DBP2